MSIYGYSNRQVNDYGLQELSEISLQMPWTICAKLLTSLSNVQTRPKREPGARVIVISPASIWKA